MADDSIVMTDALRAELASITSTQRAAVLMLLLGEDQAADIIKFLNPKEVQALGAAMVSVADFSQEAVNVVLDEFVEHLKKQSTLSMGNTDYVIRRIFDDRESRVAGLDRNIDDIGDRIVLMQTGHAGPRSHHISRNQLTQGQSLG